MNNMNNSTVMVVDIVQQFKLLILTMYNIPYV